jgi:Ca2+-binding RTX toxin-like protein
MALLGVTLLLPVFMNNGDDDDEGAPQPVEPVEPAEPQTPTSVLEGTAGDDSLSATSETPIVNGNDGNDTLVSGNTDGQELLLDGGNGDDLLQPNVLVGFPDVTQGPVVLTGGAGSDAFVVGLDVTSASSASSDDPLVVITDFDPDADTLDLQVGARPSASQQFEDITQIVADDGSYTDLVVRYADTTGTAPDLLATVRVEGISGLEADQFTVTNGLDLREGTAGNDTLSSTGADFGTRDGPDTLSGLAGDDILTHTGADESLPLVLQGGAGNDTLIADEIELSNPTTLDGGTGDDLLRTELFIPASLDTVDTFITGAGADTIEISSVFDGLTGNVDYGLTARVTDFTPGEDMIVIDTTPISDGAAATFTQTVSLTENIANAYTDVSFVVTNTANNSTFSGIVRLEGLTGLSADDIGVSLSDPVQA